MPYLTGKQFNEKYKDTEFYKILQDNLTHYGFTYRQGLNIDTNKFNPFRKCQFGGLYFTTIDHILSFSNYGNKISLVRIPDDANVYAEKYKFKADKIILSNITYLSDFHKFSDASFCKMAVQHIIDALKYVKKQTEELCKLAVQQYGCILRII